MPMFTRQHYEAIAKVIKLSNSTPPFDGEVKHALASDIALMFQGDNPNFNYGKFMKACGF